MDFATNSAKFKAKNSKFLLDCRFYSVDRHSSMFCNNYASLEDRVKSCNELDIRINCTNIY